MNIEESTVRKAVSLLSHYAQKYVMEKYSLAPVKDDCGYEDNLFATLEEICASIGEPSLDRAELVVLCTEPDGILMWGE